MNYPWDEVMVTIRRNMWLRRHRLAMFGFHTSDRILDLGCGDGLDIYTLRGQGYIHVTGVDISQKLLSAAKKRNPGMRLVRASADSLPFKDGAFDAVLADSMLYHIVGNKKALKEIRRVLEPGGRLCFIEMRQSTGRKLLDALTVSPIGRVFPYLRRRREAYRVEKQSIVRWQRREDGFFRTLSHIGFQKEWVRYDLLSVIGKYRTSSPRYS